MEARNERERYIANPLRLVRSLADLAFTAVRAVDDNLADFGDYIESRPYNEVNYPPFSDVETPMMTEEELMGQLPLWEHISELEDKQPIKL